MNTQRTSNVGAVSNTHFGAGFTLIEAMVAVSILALSIGGPLYAANRALVATQIARDRLTASYLAQEAIESVRENRDDLYVGAVFNHTPTSEAWTGFLGDISSCISSVCTVDTSLRPQPYSYDNCARTHAACDQPLYLSDVDGVTQYSQQSTSGSTQTVFTRTIQATPIEDDDNEVIEVGVVATVSWVSRGATYNVSITDHLTPWH